MVSIKRNIEIPDDNIFLNDLLNREREIEYLTKFINKTEENFVMSINSDWGDGKTTFIKMWIKYLLKEKKNVVYYNAWENDDCKEPLISIINTIEDDINKTSETEVDINNVIEKSKEMMKSISYNLVDKISMGLIDCREIENIIVDNAYKSHKAYKKRKMDLREALKILAENNDKIIVFIDELDRCRPVFAIELLERIKHIFDIDKYIFVLAIDRDQLSYSIKTQYGINMDSDGYLKKFIDMEYLLGKPCENVYLEQLIKTSDIYQVEKAELFISYIFKLVEYYKFSLRDMDKLVEYLKIFTKISVFSDDIKYRPDYIEYVSAVYSYLIILMIKSPKEYKKIMNKKYDKDYIKTINTKIIKNKIASGLQCEINPKNQLHECINLFLDMYLLSQEDLKKSKSDGKLKLKVYSTLGIGNLCADIIINNNGADNLEDLKFISENIIKL